MPAENGLAVTALNVYPLKVLSRSTCSAYTCCTTSTRPQILQHVTSDAARYRVAGASLCRRRRCTQRASTSTVTGSLLLRIAGDFSPRGVIPSEGKQADAALNTHSRLLCVVLLSKKFLTLNGFRMALIEVSLPPQAFTDDPQSLPEDSVLSLRAPGQSELKVSLTKSCQAHITVMAHQPAPSTLCSVRSCCPESTRFTNDVSVTSRCACMDQAQGRSNPVLVRIQCT